MKRAQATRVVLASALTGGGALTAPSPAVVKPVDQIDMPRIRSPLETGRATLAIAAPRLGATVFRGSREIERELDKREGR